MKKRCLVLALCLCLLLTACGSSNNVPAGWYGGSGTSQDKDVKKVTEMIDALGEITLESGDAIREAQAAFDALTDRQMAQVKNFETLQAAWNSFYSLAVVGQWHYAPTVWDFEYDDVPDFTLSEDGTFQSGETEGTWKVEGNLVYLQKEDNAYWEDYTIREENGEVTLIAWEGSELIPLADYQARTEGLLMTVDITDTDLSEYLGFAAYEYETYDAWDEPTGDSYKNVVFTNKLYEQGWVYWYCSDDLQFEINIPEYTYTYAYADGRIETFTEQAEEEHLVMGHSLIFAGDWSGPDIYPYDYKTADCTLTTDLDLEEITFGRARGQITYISKDFVKEIKEVDGYRVIVIEVNGETRECSFGEWNESNPY